MFLLISVSLVHSRCSHVWISLGIAYKTVSEDKCLHVLSPLPRERHWAMWSFWLSFHWSFMNWTLPPFSPSQHKSVILSPSSHTANTKPVLASSFIIFIRLKTRSHAALCLSWACARPLRVAGRESLLPGSFRRLCVLLSSHTASSLALWPLGPFLHSHS